MAKKKFNGVIKLDVRDSKSDWSVETNKRVELDERAQGRKLNNIERLDQ
jgi:hypothetical protein